jgi:hypothetical protein
MLTTQPLSFASLRARGDNRMPSLGLSPLSPSPSPSGSGSGSGLPGQLGLDAHLIGSLGAYAVFDRRLYTPSFLAELDISR